ncbi:SEC-C metal-binding domain-containing protein [Neolewinella lacunae]|nr:SEC-C metal-binding domain-containing protein [Neolewinella lacunae]MDN3635471.1 SEC-C metal-binding domain-containing protein [Neolewinella lacunae]
MSTIETIIKDIGENQPILIPQMAIDHLESVPADSSFAGSVFVAKTLVPTLFLKLTAKSAALVGFTPDSYYNPSYKFLTVDDQDGNAVMLVTLQHSEKRLMHAQLDPADRQVQEFLRLAKQQECFCLDLTVDHKNKPYGSTEFFDIDGEHLEWVTRNLVRATSVKTSNDWSVVSQGYQRHLGFFNRDVFLHFRLAGKRQLHANRSFDFVTRGEESHEVDLDLVQKSGNSYQIDWLASQHGISLTEAPALPVPLELSRKMTEIEANSTTISASQQTALEALRIQYPDEAIILFPLLVLYENSGNEQKRREVLSILERFGQTRTYVALSLLQILDDEAFLSKFRKEWPGKELTDHPIRGGHPFTPKDFTLFEELSIRYARLKQQTEVAIDRFTRLTEFGANWEVLESVANNLSEQLLFRQLDQNPVLPDTLPDILRKVKNPTALKLLTDNFWGKVEVLRTKVDLRTKAEKASTMVRKGPKIGRNAPCPCGSGKKYKNCCGK